MRQQQLSQSHVQWMELSTRLYLESYISQSTVCVIVHANEISIVPGRILSERILCASACQVEFCDHMQA